MPIERRHDKIIWDAISRGAGFGLKCHTPPLYPAETIQHPHVRSECLRLCISDPAYRHNKCPSRHPGWLNMPNYEPDPFSRSIRSSS